MTPVPAGPALRQSGVGAVRRPPAVPVRGASRGELRYWRIANRKDDRHALA